MLFCPKCGCEYREELDIEICPDCGADLVPEPPPDIGEEYEGAEWAELHTFPGTLYAKMAVEMLNREGIPAYSHSTFGGGIGFGPSIGGDFVGASATVFVLEPDLEGAMDIIEPMINELPHDEEADEYNEFDR